MTDSKDESSSNLKSLALEKMRKDVGVWDCRWEFLDNNGQVISVANGTQKVTFVIPDSVTQVIMDVPEMETYSVTQRFFHPGRQKLFWVSVDNKGDMWQFVEELDNQPSHSLPHDNNDGTTTYLRFTPIREEENEVDVLMEMSEDNESWQPIFRQFRVRR
jgi:hypothetical protein